MLALLKTSSWNEKKVVDFDSIMQRTGWVKKELLRNGLHDIEDAGAFIEKEVWDSFIIKKAKKVINRGLENNRPAGLQDTR